MVRHGPQPAALVGKTIAGRFRVQQHLGSGGTAHVYLASPVGSTTRVALKVLREEHRSGATLARFEREAIAAHRVRHANVLDVFEVHLDAEPACFSMELLVGLDLADTLAFSRILAPARAARIALGLAAGLGNAHAEGVVHRDVKPENVFLVHSPDGREIVKILDFGFASMHDGGPSHAEHEPTSGRRLVVGTPEYMAPEQAAGAATDARADVYALGVVLFEMLAGRLPFIAPYSGAERRMHRAPPAIRAVNPAFSGSSDLEAVVGQALARSADDRFASMDAFAEALRWAMQRRDTP